jgi:hypothetical protein
MQTVAASAAHFARCLPPKLCLGEMSDAIFGLLDGVFSPVVFRTYFPFEIDLKCIGHQTIIDRIEQSVFGSNCQTIFIHKMG